MHIVIRPLCETLENVHGVRLVEFLVVRHDGQVDHPGILHHQAHLHNRQIMPNSLVLLVDGLSDYVRSAKGL